MDHGGAPLVTACGLRPLGRALVSSLNREVGLAGLAEDVCRDRLPAALGTTERRCLRHSSKSASGIRDRKGRHVDWPYSAHIQSMTMHAHHHIAPSQPAYQVALLAMCAHSVSDNFCCR